MRKNQSEKCEKGVVSESSIALFTFLIVVKKKKKWKRRDVYDVDDLHVL